MNLQLHKDARKTVDSLSEILAHAVLLTGVSGVGLHTIARHIATKHATALIDIAENSDSIGIEKIRDLYAHLRTQQKGTTVILIDDADKMTIEAQNAFLKLLEEPGKGISFILTTHSPSLLLPTIRSRVQAHHLPPAVTDDNFLQTLNSKGIDPVKKRQITFMAAGLPAEITRLVTDDNYFSQSANAMRSAREFLEKDAYGQLIIIHQYSTDRHKARQLLYSLEVLLRHSLYRLPARETAKKLAAVLEIEERLQENGHPRTQLLRLVF